MARVQTQPAVVAEQSADRPGQATNPAAQWDAFLSHLAVAEKAAGDQFALIAEGLTAQGHPEAARRYHAMACEEYRHYEQVSRAYQEFVPPPAGFLELCGGLVTASTPLVERMAVTHLAHETAALAFLGHVHGHVHEQLTDSGKARHLRELCAELLREEVKHVRDGKAFIGDLLPRQSQAVKDQLVSSVRLHRCLLVRTVRRLFPGDGVRPFVDGMITNFNRRCRAAMAEVL